MCVRVIDALPCLNDALSCQSHDMLHRRRNMLKVEGAIDIIAWKILTTSTFRSNHAHFCINEALGQTGKDFLAVEQAESQPEDSL